MKKNIIITADDFGKDINSNNAIIAAFEKDILKSTCLITNLDGFKDALEKIKVFKDKIDIGLHLNVFEGKSLLYKNKTLLTKENGEFFNSFLKLLINSYNKNFLKLLEDEFCAQIERALDNGVKISYINSHVHIHSIPNIFKIVVKLCEKYDIKAIRTQAEPFYFVNDFKRHLKIDYFINIIKHILLNYFTYINKKYLKNTSLVSNDEFLGVLYTANMDKDTIIEGVKKVKNNAEIILHPTLDKNKPLNFIEFQTLLDDGLIDELKTMDINLLNWHDLTFMS